MTMRAFLEGLATGIRSAVRPWVVGLRGRGIVGTAAAGDATFEVDRVAEERLDNLLRKTGRSVLYYSEDRGLVSIGSGKPQAVLIVDPIDGTRNARAGFEACMVSIAAIVAPRRSPGDPERSRRAGPLLRPPENLTLGDVTHACLAEIIGRRVFYAERGHGAEWREGSRTFRPRLSSETDLDRISWSLGIVGRPSEPIFQVMGELVDRTSLTAGFFTCNSTSFSLTRLVTGQLDATLDIANRIYRDRPDTHAAFAAAGLGSIMGLCPYDIAAAVLVAQEAGCTVTDAYGEPLDSAPALTAGPESLRSCIAAANPTLHSFLVKYVNSHSAR
jgi:myo-inositol-1(or 4)-monophosphatase